MNSVNPRWKIERTLDHGKAAWELYTKHQPDLEKRLKPGQAQTLKSGLELLGDAKAGQTEVLTIQKTKTQTKEKILADLFDSVGDLKTMIRNATNDHGILKAFGIGETVNSNSISSVQAATNTFITAYNDNTQWAQAETGILQEDIARLESLETDLENSSSNQGAAKMNRKVKTVDKNTLQRQVEDITARISGAGVLTYRFSRPELVPLFEALVPSSNGTKNQKPDNGDTSKPMADENKKAGDI